MFDDDDESVLRRKAGLPLPLENLSVADLDGYAQILQDELKRVATEKQRKQVIRQSADGFFKSDSSHGG